MASAPKRERPTSPPPPAGAARSSICASLGCSEQRLRLAVAAVGPELDEVCNHLGTVPLARPLDTLAGNGTAH